MFVILGVFYSCIFNPVNGIDDAKMFLQFDELIKIDWAKLFRPRTSFYYRPILILSYMGDKFLWDLSPSFMHLENVLIHCFNALLVFLFSLKFSERTIIKNNLFPFFAALLFGLHPINTESVNWISGRTDPLATFFVLFSVLVLIHAVEKKSIFKSILASLIFILGVMSKETVLFFLPVAMYLILQWPAGVVEDDKKRRIYQCLCFASPFFFGIFAYLFFRESFWAGKAFGITDILGRFRYDLVDSVRVFFKVFGFYIKKLFIPAPLNFAIITFSNFYALLGIPCFFLSIYLLFSRKLRFNLIGIAFYLILPGIMIALADITWTPVAERYLYLSSAFFSIGCTSQAFHFAKCFDKEKLLIVSFASLLILCGYITNHRNLLWQDNLSLYRDTLAKSPQFNGMRNQIGIELIESRQLGLAKDELDKGLLKSNDSKSFLFFINMSRVAVAKGDLPAAREIILQAFTQKQQANPEVLKMLARIDEKSLFIVVEPNEKEKVIRELIDTYDCLFPMIRDPSILYRKGQLALFVGESAKALESFQRAGRLAPKDAYYRAASIKLAAKLENEAR